jgi:hypothetical protein
MSILTLRRAFASSATAERVRKEKKKKKKKKKGKRKKKNNLFLSFCYFRRFWSLVARLAWVKQWCVDW